MIKITIYTDGPEFSGDKWNMEVYDILQALASRFYDGKIYDGLELQSTEKRTVGEVDIS